VNIVEEQGVGGTLHNSQHFGGKGACLELRDGTKKIDKHLITHTDLHKTKQQVG